MTKREIEQEIISRLLMSPEKTMEAAEILNPSDFDFYRKEYETILNAFVEDENVITAFKKAKIKYANLLDVTTFREPSKIAKDLKDLSNAQKIKKILEKYHDIIPEKDLDKFVSKLQVELLNTVDINETEKTLIKDIIEDFKLEVQEYKDKPQGSLIGIPTGYEKLDNIIDGLRPEHLWIIGAYTNMGKTFATLNIVANLIKQKKRVVIYSLEMSKNDVVARLLGILTNQNGLSIMKGSNKQTTDEAVQELIESNLSIITNKTELSQITISMMEENLKNPVDLFVVDFIQLVTMEGAKSEYETTTETALQFQKFAKKLKKPIMVVSQISNDGAKNQNDMVMSFKGSGAIAAAADLAIEIRHAEENATEYKRKIQAGEPVNMKWLIMKNRHGKVGYIPLEFNGYTGIFKDPLQAF
ncbi:MAG: AAA family ATPase [Bacteroidetes bacterium]|nr:AAA family ATPase [Bacteroidota bacterium]